MRFTRRKQAAPEPNSPEQISPEQISPEPPVRIDRQLLTQSWLDVTFLHWAVEPEIVAPLLPIGSFPDVYDGRTYVGLIAFRMHRIGWFNLPGLPYLGTFPETNVRLYSVDSRGRRAVVFRSLEASRLLPVLAARVFFRLPYCWAKMTIGQQGENVKYMSRRRWPKPVGARSRITVKVGSVIADPTPLEHFLTARWGLHNSPMGKLMYLPNEHPRWPLHRAELVECDDELVKAAGLPQPMGPPISVLYSPGVPVKFGFPR